MLIVGRVLNIRGLGALMVVVGFILTGCGVSKKQRETLSQLQESSLSTPPSYILECNLHLMKDGRSLFQTSQTSSRFLNEGEAKKGVAYYSKLLEGKCFEALRAEFAQDAFAYCKGQLGASRAIFCSTKAI